MEVNMKTLANCTPKEFATQALLIAEKIKKYADGIKKIKEQAEGGNTDIFSVVSYICGDNIDDTMSICGALCFMSGEEFANLEPDENGENDGILALVDIANSRRCIRFFTTALQLSKLSKTL
jgi:hypothetical protein